MNNQHILAEDAAALKKDKITQWSLTGLDNAAGIQSCFLLGKQALCWTKCIAEKNINYTLK